MKEALQRKGAQIFQALQLQRVLIVLIAKSHRADHRIAERRSRDTFSHRLHQFLADRAQSMIFTIDLKDRRRRALKFGKAIGLNNHSRAVFRETNPLLRRLTDGGTEYDRSCDPCFKIFFHSRFNYSVSLQHAPAAD